MRSGILRHPLAVAFIGTALGAGAPGARAAGFQIQEQSGSGLGVGFAGQAAAVHDASTAFWNPAGQTLLPGRQAAAALSLIRPSNKFRDNGTSTFGALGNGGDGGEKAVVPALYGTWALDARWSVGLALNAPFGLATEWDSTWAGQFHAVRSKIKTLNFNPTLAYRFSDMLSIGGGITYQRLEAELTNRAVLAPPFPTSAIGLGRVEGDDWGWGFNLGAMLTLGPQTRVGVTYRSEIEYTVKGDLTFEGFPAAVPGRAVRADIKLPQVLSLGVSHQLSPRIRLLADWTWTGWDVIPELRVVDAATGATISDTRLGFDNSWRAGLGAEYALNPSWLLRAGLVYDTTPVQDAYRTPRLPDENRTWLALGARYQPAANASWWLDVGYAHIFIHDATSNLPFAGASASEAQRGALRGTYEANVDILAVQVGFKF